jgi:hypothetical protein
MKNNNPIYRKLGGNRLMRKALVLLVFFTLAILPAKPLYPRTRVSPANNYERLIAIVPMIGTGSAEDPRRPQFTPANGVAGNRQGLIGFSFQLSDDENYALVEFVAMNRAAFRNILAGAKNGLQVFERGKFKKEDLAAAWSAYKKDFNLETSGVNLP